MLKGFEKYKRVQILKNNIIFVTKNKNKYWKLIDEYGKDITKWYEYNKIRFDRIISKENNIIFLLVSKNTPTPKYPHQTAHAIIDQTRKLIIVYKYHHFNYDDMPKNLIGFRYETDKGDTYWDIYNTKTWEKILTLDSSIGLGYNHYGDYIEVYESGQNTSFMNMSGKIVHSYNNKMYFSEGLSPVVYYNLW